MADNHPDPGHPDQRRPGSAPFDIALTIDARGLACPLPVLRLRKSLGGQPSGAVVELLATDRAAARDVPAFCDSAGHGLLDMRQDQDGLRFIIRARG